MAPVEQVLTVAAMRAAEEALIAGGTTADSLMESAGRGAAEWVWRVAAGRAVTVLCGPGNNGGDGYVIAETIRQRGGAVQVVAALEPGTAAARHARGRYGRAVLGPDAAELHGEVLVDCLFGSGLTRALTDEHAALLCWLAARHHRTVAIDVPSGVDSDSGALLNSGLPASALTVALGAWKPAHFLMPAAATMGALRLVGIGCAAMPGAARVTGRPRFCPPPADAHKYRRGLVAVVGGTMAGAALLACHAAQGAGAGYVRLVAGAVAAGPDDLVIDERPVAEALADARIGAVLVGPGLGRDAAARARLEAALACGRALVLDADALVLLRAGDGVAGAIATPHEGELAALERAFGLAGRGNRMKRARALAEASGMVVLAKGPDTVIAAADGRMAFVPRAPSWLSAAGTGDVLAGIVASRRAAGAEAFAAAGEAAWLHGDAARRAGPAFSAGALVAQVQPAYAACL